jgi:serine/threonine-protein phosphatase 2A regulatory subunit A
VVGKVDDKFLNDKLIPLAFRLGEDPVPNIRFNFAKVIESIFAKLSQENKRQAKECLAKMIENEKVDFDVKYFAEKALKSISK